MFLGKIFVSLSQQIINTYYMSLEMLNRHTYSPLVLLRENNWNMSKFQRQSSGKQRLQISSPESNCIQQYLHMPLCALQRMVTNGIGIKTIGISIKIARVTYPCLNEFEGIICEVWYYRLHMYLKKNSQSSSFSWF